MSHSHHYLHPTLSLLVLKDLLLLKVIYTVYIIYSIVFNEKPITDPPPPTDNSSSDTGSSDSHSGSSSHVNKKTNILLEGTTAEFYVYSLLLNFVFTGQYRTIAFDQKGLFYHSEDHGVTVIIPENAVKGPATIQFTASRLWPNFKCAKGSYEPVSPFVYICTKDKLSEPAQVDIPHYIDGDDKDNIVVLVKGHRKNAAFEVLENSKFQVNQTTACVEMKHFCVFCLAVAREGKPKKRRYHVLCAEKTTQYTKDVQICILYNPQCFKVIIIIIRAIRNDKLLLYIGDPKIL